MNYISSAVSDVLDRRASDRAKAIQAQQNKLVPSAYLGDPNAMQDLMAVNPELGIKVQQAVTQRQATQQQADLDKRARFEADYKDVMSNISRFQDFESSRAYAESRIADLQQRYPEITASLGADAIYDEEDYSQARTLFGIKPSDKFKSESDLRKEFFSTTKSFSEQDAAYGRILASVKEPSAAGDLSLIYGYMKLLDPTSTVMEGEQASASNAAGVPERIRGMYNRAVTGERLTESTRQDFINQATSIYDQAYDQYQQTKNQFEEIASKQGFDLKNALPDRATAIKARDSRVVMEHPKLGKITEADIRETMRAENLSRQQVMERLKQ